MVHLGKPLLVQYRADAHRVVREFFEIPEVERLTVLLDEKKPVAAPRHVAAHVAEGGTVAEAPAAHAATAAAEAVDAVRKAGLQIGGRAVATEHVRLAVPVHVHHVEAVARRPGAPGRGLAGEGRGRAGRRSARRGGSS